MARYRCFCMTESARIITGAFIEADDAARALDIAIAEWRHISQFAWVEMWLGADRVYPVNSLALPHVSSGVPGRPVALAAMSQDALQRPASTPGWISQREIGAGAGQAPGRGMAMTAAQKPD